MGYKKHIFGLLICLLVSAVSFARTLSDQARVSLLTCAPGEALYEHFGHTGIRVCDPELEMDLVFNYGIFNFNTDHFYWKFIKGETWYELGVTPYWWFMHEYEQTNRPVYEQVLNLTPEQRNELYEALVTNYQPENRQYLYNFVFDNCATRPYNMIKRIFSIDNENGIRSDYQGAEGMSYRRFIQRYTPKGSWADFGINLVFGPKADKPMHGEKRLFLPEELMFYFSQARTANGTLVSSEQIASFEIQPVPWYKTWYFGLALYFLFVAWVSLYDRSRGKRSKWVEIVPAILYVGLLVIVTFLTFFSSHPLVGFGWRLLIIPAIHLCARLVYIIR